MLIHIYQIVDFLVEHVYVGKQIVVLFFTFNESILYLNDISKTCGFFYCVKGFIDDFHISLVIINQFHFLFVIYYKFSQSLFQDGSCIILDCVDLSCLNSASSVEFRIFKLFVEFSQATIVIRFILLIFHFQTQHQILTHIASILTGFDVLSQGVDLMLSFFNVTLQTFEIILIHNFFLSQHIDVISEFFDFSHSLIVSFVVLSFQKCTMSICFCRFRILVNISFTSPS